MAQQARIPMPAAAEMPLGSDSNSWPSQVSPAPRKPPPCPAWRTPSEFHGPAGTHISSRDPQAGVVCSTRLLPALSHRPLQADLAWPQGH